MRDRLKARRQTKATCLFLSDLLPSSGVKANVVSVNVAAGRERIAMMIRRRQNAERAR